MSKGMKVCMCVREKASDTVYIYMYVSVISIINLP